MIERMSKITVFSESSKKEELLLALRELGVVHISDLVEKSDSVDLLEKDSSRYHRLLTLIEDANGKALKDMKQVDISDDEFYSIVNGLEFATSEIDRIDEELRSLTAERDRIAPFGDFDLSYIEYLRANGFNPSIYLVSKKDLSYLDKAEDFVYLRVLYSGKQLAIMTFCDTIPKGVNAFKFEIPEKPLGDIEARILSDTEERKALLERFVSAGSYVDAIKKRVERNSDRITYEKVSATVKDTDDIIYISGYIPVQCQEQFKEFCTSKTIGYLMEEPGEEDNPPSKIKRSKVSRFIGPVLDMLNIVPGYNEPDISLWFEIFLTLFFAIILGDAGYGLVFLIGAVILNIKSKKCSDMNALIYIFSVATIMWGSITGTWFGSEAILKKIPFLQFFIVPAISNFPELSGMDPDYTQNMMMKLCFLIGTVHISLACLINIFRKIQRKDLSFLSDVGWLLDTCLLYLLVLYLVIGEAAPLKLIAGGVGLGFVLVCCFASQAPGVPFVKGLIASLGGFFTNFLNTVTCFSNIMSYIRLFAVGMASLAIAQSFNGMASPLLQGLALPFGILVLVLGHVINLVMGMLSVVVHGVRLNVLEFSNQLGMEWSGYNYDPFRDKSKDRLNNAV